MQKNCMDIKKNREQPGDEATVTVLVLGTICYYIKCQSYVGMTIKEWKIIATTCIVLL